MSTHNLDDFGERALDAFMSPQGRDRSPRDLAILASATRGIVAHRQRLGNAAGPVITLATYAWGEPGLPGVLLAHGWELQAGRMGPFVEPLLRAGYRVLAVDLPGHGASEGSQLTVPGAADALRDAARAGGGVEAVIGHSFGALAALHFAADAADGTLRAVVGIGASSGAEDRADVAARLHGWDAARVAAFNRAFAARFGGPPADFGVRQFGGRVRAPVLLVHDRRDTVVDFAQSDIILAHTPAARRLATSGLGHRAILRDAEVLAEVLRFLKNPGASLAERGPAQ